MSGPDGLEERTAADFERSEREHERLELLDRDAEDEDLDDPIVASPAEQIAHLRATLQDIVFGADCMLQPALSLKGSFLRYVQEVKAVAEAGLLS
jgi:hypothetical protein